MTARHEPRRSREERDALVLQWKGLPLFVCRQLWHLPSVRQLGTVRDVTQIGFLALLRAAELYDPEQGAKFSTYACRAIRSLVIVQARTGGLIHVPAWATDPGRADDEATGLAQAARRFVPLFERHTATRTPADYDHLYAALDRLGEFDRRLLSLRFGLGGECLEQKEIARQMGLSNQRVSQIVHRALDRLKKQMAEEAKEAS
jgi:RNA polymerase sigma factor (sigma-70 family)